MWAHMEAEAEAAGWAAAGAAGAGLEALAEAAVEAVGSAGLEASAAMVATAADAQRQQGPALCRNDPPGQEQNRKAQLPL